MNLQCGIKSLKASVNLQFERELLLYSGLFGL